MRLKNKKTGEIKELTVFSDKFYLEDMGFAKGESIKYDTLAELNEEWEDYEDPKDFYIVEQRGTVGSRYRTGAEYEKMFKQIGNYFETKEEAEKAVERLRAWKRLKDKGFKFNSCKIEMSEIIVPEITITAFIHTEEPETLNLVNLLFGGEDE